MIRFTIAFDSRRLVAPWAAMAGFALLATWFVLATYGLWGYPIGADSQTFWAMVREKYDRYSGVYLPGPALGINGSELLPILFPLLTLAVGLSHLGIGHEALPRVIYILYTFAAMSGTYVLIRRLLGGRVASERRDLAAVAGAVLYGINQWTITASAIPFVDLTLTTAVLPWAAWGAAYAAMSGFRLGSALIALGFVVGGVGNPARFAAIPLVMVIVALGVGWDANRLRRALAVLVAGTVLGLTCCLWWLLPLPTIVSAGLNATALQGHHWLSWMSGRSTLLNLYKLDGGLTTGGLLDHRWYSSPVADFLSYLPLAVALVGLGRLRSRLSVVLLGALLAGVFLAKGSQPPFGDTYQFLIDRLPGFSIFRSPYDKWVIIPALALSVLFAFGIVALGRDLERGRWSLRRLAWTPLVATLGVLATLSYAWPVLAGRNLSILPAGYRFTGYVPATYRSLTRYIHHVDPSARVIIFNEGLLPYARFNWGYIGDDPLLTLSQNPITSFGDVLDGFEQIDSRALAAAFQRLSARFVLVHRDVANPENSPDVRRLVRDGIMRPMIQVPYLALYELTRVPDPFVRAPAAVFRISSGPSARSDDDAVAGLPEFDPNWSALVHERGREVNFVDAPRPADVLGTAREVRPSSHDARLTLQMEPGETLFYAPAAIFGRFDNNIPCAVMAARQGRQWRPDWSVEGVTLPLIRSSICPRGTPAGEAARDDVISFGSSAKAQVRDVRRLGPQLGVLGEGLASDRNMRWKGSARQGSVQTIRRDRTGHQWIQFVGREWGSIGSSGRLDPRNSYEFDLQYDDPESEALVRYSDEVVTRDVYLVSGGARHTLRLRIFPSRIDGGHFQLAILTYNGVVDIFASSIHEIGPNGTFFALKDAARANLASLSGLRWNLLDGADFDLTSCAQCFIESPVNGGGSWLVGPRAATMERTIGFAHAGDSLRALSPGIAGWVLAMPKSSHLSIRYEPRTRFQFGLLLSLAGLAIVLVLGISGLLARKPMLHAAPVDPAPATRVQIATALLVACSAPAIHFLPGPATAVLGTGLALAFLFVAAASVVGSRGGVR